MNAPLHPELLRAVPAQASLPLASPGVQRIVWAGRYGEMLIEVCDGRVRVNGDWVEPASPAPLPWRRQASPHGGPVDTACAAAVAGSPGASGAPVGGA